MTKRRLLDSNATYAHGKHLFKTRKYKKYYFPNKQFTGWIEEDVITVETRIFGLKYQMERNISKQRRKIIW